MGPKKKTKENVYDAKKEYIDRAKAEKNEFPEFEITSKNIDTIVLLLGANENEIVLRVLHHLDKFASKLPENAQQLNEAKTVEKISEHKLFEHDELFIKRFALKLIAQIFQAVQLKFEEETIYRTMTAALDYYLRSDDDFIVEYSGLILLKMIQEPRLSAALQDDIEIVPVGIFKHLAQTKDPDILYNSYRLLIQLLRERDSLSDVCSFETFPFERVLSDINNIFLEIRKAAIDTLADLALCKEEYYLSRFCCKAFLEEWFKVIENRDAVETHTNALELGRRLLCHEKFAVSFYTNCLMRFHIFYNKTEYVDEATKIYYELSMYPEAWQFMYDTGIVTPIRNRLKDVDKVTFELCVIIGKILKHPESFLAIINSDPVPDLLGVMKSPSKDWKTRGASAEALTIIFKRNLEACQTAIEHNVSAIASVFLNIKYGEIPFEVYINILNLLNSLARNEDIRSQVMTMELAESLFSAIKNSARSSVLVSNLFNTASAFNKNEVLRDHILTQSYWDIILKYLRSPAVMVQNAVADFIMLTGKTRDFAEPYIDEGILSHLLADDSALISCSNWSPAIESILSANLSVKFTVRGRLDFTDVTSHNFFVSKHHFKDINSFNTMIREEASPRHTLILVNYDHRKCSASHIVHVPKVCADGITVTPEEDCSYCLRPNDPYLPQYLEKVRNRLESQGLCDRLTKPNLIEVGKLKDHVHVIANVVSEEMCGTRPGQQKDICTEQTVTNHLNYLKCSLNCNIIPLGQIRYGGHFERAILFKTLADKSGVPCTLQLGEDGKTLWNEVPIPSMDMADSYCGNVSTLPTRLLRPTHIVDLMDNPGNLYPLHSQSAYEYLRLM